MATKSTSSPTTRPVLYETDANGEIAVLTLNRPRVLNAYNTAMRDALYESLLAVQDDPNVRVIVVRGNGSSFCTGGDLREFGAAPSPRRAREIRWLRDVWGLLWALPKITIAAVHGFAVGAGFEMAMLCDQCIASTEARFAFPETGLGMIPGATGTQTIPRLLGVGRAMSVVLSGEWLDAQAARRLGLVSKVVARPRLQRTAYGVAKRFARLNPDAATNLKRAVNEGLDRSLDHALAHEQRLAVAVDRHAARGIAARRRWPAGSPQETRG